MGGSARCQRPNSARLVNPVAECNRLLDRIEQLEAAIERVRGLKRLSLEGVSTPTMHIGRLDYVHADELDKALEGIE